MVTDVMNVLAWVMMVFVAMFIILPLTVFIIGKIGTYAILTGRKKFEEKQQKEKKVL